MKMAHANEIVIRTSFDENGKTYNGDVLNLEGLREVKGVVTGKITKGLVSGGGLKVLGFYDKIDSLDLKFQMRMEDTTVEDSEICFTQRMPPNSYIHLLATSGTMSNSKALFKFEGLHLSKNVFLLLEGTKVRWEGGGGDHAKRAVVVFTGNEISSIDDASGLFLLNTSAENAESILSSNNINVLTISDHSALGVDWGSCTGCTGATVAVPQISVSESSMFRLSHLTVENNAPLLANEGSVSITDASLYFVVDCAVNSGSLFTFDKFIVSGSSLVSFIRLKVQGSLFATKSTVDESAVDSSSRLYANVELNGKELTEDDFQQHGLHVSAVVTSNDRLADNKCAYSSCMPNNFEIQPSEQSCGCVCKNDKYQLPVCTSVLDPVNGYDNTQKPPCKVSNCWQCTPSDENKCANCFPDYNMTEDKKCIFIEPPPPPTPKPEPTPTPIIVPSGRGDIINDSSRDKSYCGIARCQKCTSNLKFCRVCEPGYEVSLSKEECMTTQGTSRVAGLSFIGVVSALLTTVLL
ncbi:unnamed protein product [Phytomonas sp. Hart1]|nr:unnamed protein product [Phytomonas sp. Hart1]|eukprot:CCW66634.1 unnamed protein product [Phytomonas sp. isolate Hart1]